MGLDGGQRILINTPEGWLERGMVELVASDHRGRVTVTSEPALDVENAAFADGYRRLFAQLPAFEAGELRTVRLFGGRDALLHRCSFQSTEGSPVTLLVAYVVERGCGYVATASANAARFDAIEAELLAILTTIDLPDPVDAVTMGPSRSTSPDAQTRSSPTRSWADARREWQDAVIVSEPGGGEPVQLSAEELTALAWLLGAESFPHLSDGDRVASGGAARDTSLRTALHSLVARGLVDDVDRLVARSDLIRSCALALTPELLVSVGVDRPGATNTTILAADAESICEISGTRPGIYTMRSFAASALVGRLLALTAHAGPQGKVSVGTGAVSVGALDEARNRLQVGDIDRARALLTSVPGLADVLAEGGLRRVRTLYRAEGRVLGGELVWASGPVGNVRIDVDRETAHVSAIEPDGVATALLELLPG